MNRRSFLKVLNKVAEAPKQLVKAPKNTLGLEPTFGRKYKRIE